MARHRASARRAEEPFQHVSAVTCFRILKPLLKPDDKAGVLIDRVVEICFDNPPYLRKQDTERYIALLQALKEFIPYNADPDENGHVGQLAIRDLPLSLEDWVLSYFLEDCHPMLPVYALDAGRFLKFHAEGHAPFPYTWEIDPLVSPAENGCRWLMSPFQRSFKQDFSRRLGHIMVQGKVPTFAVVKNHCHSVEEIGPGSTFRFTIQRCHLSDDWNNIAPGISCDDEPLQFDLMDEFRLPGEVILPRKDDSSKLIGVPAEVPGRWITHAVIRAWNEPELLVPVPHWNLNDVPKP